MFRQQHHLGYRPQRCAVTYQVHHGLSRDRIFQIQAPVDELNGGYPAVSRSVRQALEDFNSPEFSKPEPQIPGAAAPEVPSAQTKKTPIEVLNGNGVEGAASLAANLLMQKGFTSVAIGGNASNSWR
jgi:hypothetical protein